MAGDREVFDRLRRGEQLHEIDPSLSAEDDWPPGSDPDGPMHLTTERLEAVLAAARSSASEPHMHLLHPQSGRCIECGALAPDEEG